MAILFEKLLCNNSIDNEKSYKMYVQKFLKISIKTFTNIIIFVNI